MDRKGNIVDPFKGNSTLVRPRFSPGLLLRERVPADRVAPQSRNHATKPEALQSVGLVAAYAAVAPGATSAASNDPGSLVKRLAAIWLKGNTAGYGSGYAANAIVTFYESTAWTGALRSCKR